VLEDVARFYLGDMRGRSRLDGPGARMKFTRDWEYPWVLLRGEAAPGKRMLDCGSGYSPLPFLWAKRGAAVTALDRDAVVAGSLAYLAWCAREAASDLFGRRSSPAPTAANTSIETTRRPSERPIAPASPAAPSRGPLARFVRYHSRRNRERLRRLAHPDFWGPVSPALLARYGVTYVHGDLTAMQFDDRSFDAVSCVSVLEHMPVAARLRGLREMARVLAPGGRLLLTYDVIDGDITQSLIDASGCREIELVYFRASKQLFAPNAPDVVGMVLERI
jgi:SAM-dependent methyltransferase